MPDMEDDLQNTATRLLQLALEMGALRYGDFTLTSGKKSTYYFDGRLLSLHPEGAYLASQALLPLVRAAGAEAIGGPTLGADPIVAAVSMASHLESGGAPVPAFIVRKEAKEHGMGNAVEGHMTGGSKVAVVDDTCTTGGIPVPGHQGRRGRGLHRGKGAGNTGPARGRQRGTA